MHSRAVRRQESTEAHSQGEQYTSLCRKILAESQRWAAQNSVQLSTRSAARVRQADGRIFLVDLAAATCSCLQYHENGMPCGHALQVISTLQTQLSSYLPAWFKVQRQLAIYQQAIPPINTADLAAAAEIDTVCLAPRTRIPRGRPRKRRQERADYRYTCALIVEQLQLNSHGSAVLDSLGNVQTRRHVCSTCGQNGHNKRTCRQAHD